MLAGEARLFPSPYISLLKLSRFYRHTADYFGSILKTFWWFPFFTYKGMQDLISRRFHRFPSGHSSASIVHLFGICVRVFLSMGEPCWMNVSFFIAWHNATPKNISLCLVTIESFLRQVSFPCSTVSESLLLTSTVLALFILVVIYCEMSFLPLYLSDHGSNRSLGLPDCSISYA